MDIKLVKRKRDGERKKERKKEKPLAIFMQKNVKMRIDNVPENKAGLGFGFFCHPVTRQFNSIG